MVFPSIVGNPVASCEVKLFIFFQAKKIPGQMTTETRIYVNSYMMKKSGSSDTSFEVDLGQMYTFDELSLDSAVIEN